MVACSVALACAVCGWWVPVRLPWLVLFVVVFGCSVALAYAVVEPPPPEGRQSLAAAEGRR